MNIQDMQDNNLDALFAEAADSADFKFEEKSWESLAKRLDYVALMKRVIWGGLIGGLILFFGISFLYLNDHSVSSNKTEINSQALNKPYESPTPNAKQFVSGDSNNIAMKKDRLIDHGSAEVINNDKPVENTEVVDSRVSPVFTSKNNVEPEQEFTGKNIDQIGKINAPESLNNSDLLKSAGLMESGLPGYPESLQEKSSVIINEKRNHIKTRPSWVAGITMGPEFNAVKFNESGAGRIEGLGLTMIGSRISARIGVYHVKKNYAVSNGEYKIPDPSFIRYGKSPDNISISCHVIDIPVNFYYTILNRGGNRLYAGTGISSYLMLTEEYSYQYGSASNITSRKFILRNENQHYFSILNLSIGFAKSISSTMGLEVEPYYKLPLTGIAEADVKLKSFGVLLSLDYKIK